MNKNVQIVRIEKIFSAACELPYCKIDREEFLTKELKNRVSLSQLDDALANGTVNAQIPVNMLDDIAKGAIAFESTKVTLISAAAGLPGGLAMIGTLPADLTQFYAHVFRIAQKLAYIYGSKDLELNDGAQNVLMVYLGAMFGIGIANAALAKFAAANAGKIGARIAAKPLTKYAIYSIIKKILAWIGVKLTKDTFGKAVAKVIPVIGGIVSGGLTFAMYLPMANTLQKELSKFAAMTPEDLEKESAAADIIIAEFTDVAEESLMKESEEEYYCTKCGAILNDQYGFDPQSGNVSCASCGQELYGDDVYEGNLYPGVMWHCDQCGALLNKQNGFKDSCGSWTCTECCHSNPISEDAILGSSDDDDTNPTNPTGLL